MTWEHVHYPDITVHRALGVGDDARYYQEDDIHDAIAAVHVRERERES